MATTGYKSIGYKMATIGIIDLTYDNSDTCTINDALNIYDFV